MFTMAVMGLVMATPILVVGVALSILDGIFKGSALYSLGVFAVTALIFVALLIFAPQYLASVISI